MNFLCFFAVFELMSDSLTAIYVEPHWCPSHQSILQTKGPICEIFAKNYWELAFLKNILFLNRPFWFFFFNSFFSFFFCFNPMKISPNLHGRMDELKLGCFHWFPENSLLCVILRYTVYIPRYVCKPDSHLRSDRDVYSYDNPRVWHNTKAHTYVL